MPDGAAPADAGLLALVLDEVLALRRELADLRREVHRPVDERFGALVVAAFDVVSDAPWSAAGLLGDALDDVPGRADLRVALLAVTGRRAAGAVRRLGRWLAEHDGAEAEGLRLVRLPGRGRDGTLYRVVDVIAESR